MSMYWQLDGSGSGKSASYSIPNAYQMLGSYVFTDPKGELYDRTAGYLKAHGYKIKELILDNHSEVMYDYDLIPKEQIKEIKEEKIRV